MSIRLTARSGIVGARDYDRDVIGTAPSPTLHAVNVLDQYGAGTYAEVASGLEYVVDQGWDAATLSLAGDTSSLTEDAVEYAHNNGVALIAAGQNYCSGCAGYPAAEPEVIAVDSTGSPTASAASGSAVELAAPGADIYSTVPSGYARKIGSCDYVSHCIGEFTDSVTFYRANHRQPFIFTIIPLNKNFYGS